MLTKSLHTVTAGVNVALTLLALQPGAYPKGFHRDTSLDNALKLAGDALRVLGHEMPDKPADVLADPTVLRIVRDCYCNLSGEGAHVGMLDVTGALRSRLSPRDYDRDNARRFSGGRLSDYTGP